MKSVFFGVLGIVASALVVTAAVAQTQTSNVTLKVATFGGHSGDVEAGFVSSRFTRMTGIKVELIYGNPSDHFAKMLAARGREAPFDIVLLDDAVQNAAIKAGLVAKLDPAQVPNLKQLYPQALNKQGYGPWLILYSVGIVYNKDKLKAAGIPEPTSWEDLWNPKLAEHISVPDMSLPQGADFVMKIAQIGGNDESNVIPALEKVGSSRVDLQACKLEYSIVSPK